MKNESFVGSRFWTYFKYDLMQTWRNHVKASVLIGLSGLILYVLVIAWNAVFGHVWQAPEVELRFATFSFALMALELYQTRTYGYLTEKQKGSAWLMLPASTFEKWLSMIIMTLIVIPFAFFAAFGAVDGLLSVLDPTYGEAIIAKSGEVVTELKHGLLEINGTYDTTWSAGLLIWPMVASFCVNFLYFLLCGICFKRNKLLKAFAVIFCLTIVLSFSTAGLALNDAAGFEDFAEAEMGIRGIIRLFSAGLTLVAVGLAGGIFWRLNTLKH